MSTTPPRPEFSKRSAHLREAGILRALTLKVSAFPDGINLGQGVCDLEMPRPLRLGAVESIFRDRATYTPYGGVLPLREAIVARLRTRYGLAYGPDDLCVTVGASMAYTATLMTLLDPGDEIVLFEPFYPYHHSAARLAGATVRCVRATPDQVDWDGFRAALSPRTRLVVVNTPGNPLGKVWSPAELDRLAEEIREHPTWICTDEIYEDLVYDGLRHLPPATHPALFDRTVSISGLGKSYSVTGWRLGWLAAPPALARAIGPVFDVMAVCAARPLQVAAAAALRELPESYYTSLRDDYARRRALLHDALRGGGFAVTPPRGAYYMLADYRERYGAIPPVDACFKLLEETHIAAIPGSIFFAGDPPPMLRFHFAAEDRILEEVGRRLRLPR